MPTYHVHVQCRECGGDHPILMKISLGTGPSRTQSIAEWFKERPVPPQVLALKRHSAPCLKTRKKFTLQEDDRVFLVPLEPDRSKLKTDDC